MALSILLFSACANVQIGTRIAPEDVVWIEKGVTKREEIVQRFGQPMSEVPDFDTMKFKSKSTTTTTTTKSGGSQEMGTTSSDTTISQGTSTTTSKTTTTIGESEETSATSDEPQEPSTSESETVTVTTFEQVDKITKAVYLYTQSKGGAFVGITTTQVQFWVRYNEMGIVQDYGFQPGPGMTIR